MSLLAPTRTSPRSLLFSPSPSPPLPLPRATPVASLCRQRRPAGDDDWRLCTASASLWLRVIGPRHISSARLGRRPSQAVPDNLPISPANISPSISLFPSTLPPSSPSSFFLPSPATVLAPIQMLSHHRPLHDNPAHDLSAHNNLAQPALYHLPASHNIPPNSIHHHPFPIPAPGFDPRLALDPAHDLHHPAHNQTCVPALIPPGMDPSQVDIRTFYPYTPNEVKHRKRTTRAQLKVLESVYKHDTKPNASLRKKLAAELDMTPRGVQVCPPSLISLASHPPLSISTRRTPFCLAHDRVARND